MLPFMVNKDVYIADTLHTNSTEAEEKWKRAHKGNLNSHINVWIS